MEEIMISMNEYKELLIIKGKYEELKQVCLTKLYEPTIIDKNIDLTKQVWYGNRTTEPLPEMPYKIWCKGE